MEAALLSGFINIILTKLVPLAEEKYKLHKDIKKDMAFLEKELRMISSVIDRRIGNPEAFDEVRKLAHDIEDCIDRLMYRVTLKQQEAPLWHRAVGYPKRLLTRLQIAEEMKYLRDRSEEVHDRSMRRSALASQTPSFRLPEWPESSSSSSSSSDEVLVGMNVPLKELLEQLAEAAEGQPKRRKVISIVGFRGSGKTALARKVYNSQVGQQFRPRAWVCAAKMDPTEILMEILRKLGGPVRDTSEVSQLGEDLRIYMDKQRYLIVIDDMTTNDWSTIESAFPTDGNFGSRILVTTTLQSVVTACSSGNGYVHKMGRLDEEHSKELFSKKACPEGYEEYWHQDSGRVLKKCGGQPLALVTVGQFLRKKGWPTGPSCNDVCRQLRHHLEKDDTLERMRRVLDHDYTSLSDPASKTCLLYFGMFPSDHPIRRKRLMRRWLAEGFLETKPSCVALDPAAENFSKLMDRNIIEPIDVSNNENVKTCKTYGMMREFILIKSKSENFVTLLDDETRPETRYVRRISLHHYSIVADDSSLDIDLSLVRSLTVFGKAGNAMLEFREYQLLRVLDLEECTDLGDDHLKGVCNLLLLKYLSLGGTVTSLPKEIEKLKHLETLDLRRTEVKILPKEVIMLPCLIHLFGKFKLSDKVKKTSEVKKLEQSNLETLAGFLTDESHGFPQVMEHMKNLRKVKIWCEKHASSTNLTCLAQAIQNFIHDKMEGREKPRSLSLHFDQCSEDLLSSLETSCSLETGCYLTSLTLQGKLPKLPQFVISMRGLSELCLSSTILAKGLLEALSELRHLKFLKLVADNLEEFTIKAFSTNSKTIKAFPNLLRLCFELKVPTFPTIEEGALKYLSTLQLLCKDIDGLSGIKIECLKCLKEVTLLPGVKRETREIWEKAAKEHPNRPKVLLLKSVDTAQSEPTDDSVASEQAKIESTENSAASQGSVQETAQIRDNQGSGSSSIPKKQNNFAVQSSAHDELNSALNNMGGSEVSPSFTELSIARNGMVPS